MKLRHVAALTALLALVVGFSIADEVHVFDICMATGSHPGECAGSWIETPNHSTGYIVLKTTDLASSPSMVCYINGKQPGDLLWEVTRLHTTNAITTETTVVILIGSDVSPGEGIDEVGDFPLYLISDMYCVAVGGTFTADAYIALVPDH